jgi:phosphoribosyl-AMP cyclohydrolase
LKASKIDEIDFAKGNGLVPVVTQEAKTGKVLMLAYANKEAVENTMKTKKATYWSRSRNELWVKGDTSGHVQKVRRVLVDCDNDTLLYVVDQVGPACHTGKHSCFFSKLE